MSRTGGHPVFWNTTLAVPLLVVTRIVVKPAFTSAGTFTYIRLSDGIAYETVPVPTFTEVVPTNPLPVSVSFFPLFALWGETD